MSRKRALDSAADVAGGLLGLHHHVLKIVGWRGVDPVGDGGVVHHPLRSVATTRSEYVDVVAQTVSLVRSRVS